MRKIRDSPNLLQVKELGVFLNQSKKKLLSEEGKRRSFGKPFRLSLRYKVAIPVLVFVSAMIILLFLTTFRFVREMVLVHNESRLLDIAEVFTESLKVPLALNNQEILIADLEWMAGRSDVLEVRVEDNHGVLIGSTNATQLELPDIRIPHDKNFVQRISPDRYVASVPIRDEQRPLGKLIIFFSQLGFEEELREIFHERMLVALVLGMVLALMTAGVMWVIVRPLFKLKRTVQQILSGDLSARAHIHSFDEIEDLAGAFNEMVARLARSLDNLRARTEALEESEEKYRLIVDNAGDVIFAISREGDLVFLNEGFSGYSREELIAGGLWLFLKVHTPGTRDKFQDALDTLERTQESVTHLATTHIHKRSKSEIYYLTNLTPLMDHQGQVKLIQGVMRDVTELRRVELMKESLIRDVAHELKTPTAKFEMSLNWFEKEMEADKTLEKYRPLVTMLKNNTDRLMRTITSIMDLSKLESGMDQIVKSELDLNEVLHQAVQDMEPLCGEKGLALKCVLSERPLMMRGDRDMLYRLFVNLIGNSIKFTSTGHIIVSSSGGRDVVRASVTDSGIGIEPGNLEKIFERFIQGSASSQGIGVGLTISRDIAALHDGKLWAESAGPGKGAVFHVEFQV